MSGLYASIAANSAALKAQSLALQTTGNNLANVNNPNYARQRVIFASGTSGVSVSLEQIRDSLLDKQVTREISQTSSLEARQFALQQAQAALGQTVTSSSESDPTGTDSGLAASLSDFFNSFASLAASPTDVGERQVLLQTASSLVSDFKQTDLRLSNLQNDLTSIAEADVGSVNTLLTGIANLNNEIARLELNAPGAAVDLRDLRQAKIEELSGKISITTRETNGSIEISTADGSGGEVSLVAGAAVTGTLSLSGSTVSVGTTAISLGSGSLQGTLLERDGTIQTLRDQLDTMAGQLISSVNAAYNPTGATGDFFTGTSAGSIGLVSGLTASTLKATDTGGAAGDGTIASAVAAIANRKFSTAAGDDLDGTLGNYYSAAVSTLGLAASSVTSQLEDQNTIESTVRTQRDSVSGVSLDEETADLLKYQRSFQATSRVITILDELLESVINLGR